MSRQIKILIIDADPQWQAKLRAILLAEKEFVVVGAAGAIPEGITLAQQLQPDFILVDITIPEINWTELADTIEKTILRGLVIVLGYGNESREQLLQPFAAGISTYVDKNKVETLSTTIIELKNKFQFPFLERVVNVYPGSGKPTNLKLSIQPKTGWNKAATLNEIVVLVSTPGQEFFLSTHLIEKYLCQIVFVGDNTITLIVNGLGVKDRSVSTINLLNCMKPNLFTLALGETLVLYTCTFDGGYEWAISLRDD